VAAVLQIQVRGQRPGETEEFAEAEQGKHEALKGFK
jgi:hypothetical protein